ncbi:ribonuclease III domain-containing protein [Leptodesmis sp.]|uniref:ribonuclease III domain-containing protein n=1 Tax=Leptodesmis sp. TaxID=3100501 RepID=UPI00405346E0
MTIEATLDYFFFDKRFLNRALTRKGYALEQQNCQVCEDQDALVLLGGAVLDAVLTEVLIRAGYETQQEIVLRKLELKQVENLARMSQKIGLGYELRMSKAEKLQQADCQPEILAETLEAIVGSIYLDGGFSAARQVIQRLFQDQVAEELVIREIV